MLSQAAQDYIDMRRACGFKLQHAPAYLRNFVSFAEARAEQHVYSSTAIEWASLAGNTSNRARRLGIIIRFARHARSNDPRHEVPPPVFGSETWPRRVPYILSEQEIANLVHEAASLDTHPMRRATYSTLFGLLACTGLRISEAIALRYSDITTDGLVIRKTKFRKSRLVVLHSSTRNALQKYLQQRQAFSPLNDHVFVSLSCKPLLYSGVVSLFRYLVKRLGFPQGPGLPRVTLHSLRHTFAVRSLLNCPDGRDQITHHMVALSSHLGHVNVAATYWYLQATPELLQNIACRFERFMEGAP